MQKYCLIFVSCLALLGCAGSLPDIANTAEPGEPLYAPPAINYAVEVETRGSLFTGRSSIALYKDRRAYRVGDILTVSLDEKTKSSKSASSAFAKGTGISMSAPIFGSKTFSDLSASLNSDSSFDGNSSADQGNSLSGSITVTVHEVLPNGVLRVVGEKWLKLNQGDEYIRLTGMIRADDIDANNTVSSMRIADARITYAGKGTLANANEPGWITKFLNSPWMPF